MGIIQHAKFYGINNLINTPLWNLIQEELNSSNLEWEDGAVGGEGYSKNTRKSKIAWISDAYLREQLFYSVDLYNKQNWNYDLDGCDLVHMELILMVGFMIGM